MQRILVVEDDFDIQELLQNFLQEAGYEVAVANDGVEALSLFAGERYDLIVLDIMLPQIDGYGVCELIRKQSDVPIIMLTALSGEEDQIKGLDLQVDDYITKPFEMMELLARVETVLRRYHKSEERITIFDTVIDVPSRTVTKQGKQIMLTLKEFELLLFLVRNKNIALYRETIYENIWQNEYMGDGRTVDLHIQRLRKKLHWEDKIKTVYKVGYRLEVDIAGI